MTAVIEIFVYPLAWPMHIQWAASCRGPGAISLDYLVWQRLWPIAERCAAR
jgi:putative oxidoreductase